MFRRLAVRRCAAGVGSGTTGGLTGTTDKTNKTSTATTEPEAPPVDAPSVKSAEASSTTTSTTMTAADAASGDAGAPGSDGGSKSSSGASDAKSSKPDPSKTRATARSPVDTAASAVHTSNAALTPRKIVDVLDKFVIGQPDAKKAVAVALRNRWRRGEVSDKEMQSDIMPKNILMIGPTGVGKTEIARRMAKITDAPFLKVEATKYTEVGFKGKDVESIIEDLFAAAKNKARRYLERSRDTEATEMARDVVFAALTSAYPDFNRISMEEFNAMLDQELADERAAALKKRAQAQSEGVDAFAQHHLFHEQAAAEAKTDSSSDKASDAETAAGKNEQSSTADAAATPIIPEVSLTTEDIHAMIDKAKKEKAAKEAASWVPVGHATDATDAPDAAEPTSKSDKKSAAVEKPKKEKKGRKSAKSAEGKKGDSSAEGDASTTAADTEAGAETAGDAAPSDGPFDNVRAAEPRPLPKILQCMIQLVVTIPPPPKKPTPEGEPGQAIGVSLFGPPPDEKPQKQTLSRTVKDALPLAKQECFRKLFDDSQVAEAAKMLTETEGIVFLDEIDKVVAEADEGGNDVSALGVQQDLLPLVEGSQVTLKDGTVIGTDNILFICSGAFHLVKPADMIAELQGRLPVRVTLQALKEEDFRRILTEPEFNLLAQQRALLAVEKINVQIKEDGVHEIARMATELNKTTQNIGARRLHTIMERVFDDVSFNCDEYEGKTVAVDKEFVAKGTHALIKNVDLARYLL